MAIGKCEHNWCYTIPDGEHKGKTLYSGRYTGVSAIIIAETSNGNYILANRRGKGTSDEKGLWNMPGGFLDGNESGIEGISREVAEECGIYIEPSKFKLIEVLTNPKRCNNCNVILRHLVILDKKIEIGKLQEGGEKDEVADVQWINLQEVDNYKWAWLHKQIIDNMVYGKVSLLSYHYHTNTLTVQYD